MQELYRLFFKAFSNKTRFEIIRVLKRKPLTVKEICEKRALNKVEFVVL